MESAVNNERNKIKAIPFTDWGQWANKQHAFYTRCTKLVEKLTEADIRALAPITYDIKKAGLGRILFGDDFRKHPLKIKVKSGM